MADTCAACGLPVADHFTDTRRKLSCEQLRCLRALRPGHVIRYWRGPELIQAELLSIEGSSAVVHTRDGELRLVSIDRFYF